MFGNFTYSEQFKEPEDGFHVLEIDFECIDTKKELLQKYYDSLQFPGYFGFNWDALSDMLRDLHWLDSKKVMIKHFGNCGNFPEFDLKIYVDVLQQVVNDWLDDGEGEVMVYFSASSKKQVEHLL